MRKLILTSLLFGIVSISFPQIKLNEILTSNQKGVTDYFDDPEDWIELYNTTNAEDNLISYSLSDDITKLSKWSFPPTTIAAKGYVAVFASGKAVKVGEEIHSNFNLSSGGESLYLSKDGVIVDSVRIPVLETDYTFGRSVDGAGSWAILSKPTYKTSNDGITQLSGFLRKPDVSIPAGFYTGTQSLQMTCPDAGAVVKYTKDGNWPLATSTTVTGAVSISKTTTITSICTKSGYANSAKKTDTYFIGDAHVLPVVSITTPPAGFFSSDSGIYVEGPNAEYAEPHYGANYWENWEREIHIEYFDKNKQEGFEQDLGCKIMGGWSRANDQKSLRLIPRKKYGQSKIEYPIFSAKNQKEYDQIVLRSSGNDFRYTQLKDGMNHQAMGNLTHLDKLEYEPAIVYINGVYFGIQNIRERANPEYCGENHNVDHKTIDYLEENGGLPTANLSADPIEIVQGSNTWWAATYDFITTNDLSVEANYKTVEGMIDVDNWIDYITVEMYHTNWDWPHNNIRMWRSPDNGGQWRYIYYDTDFSYGLFGFANVNQNWFDVVFNQWNSQTEAPEKKRENVHAIMWKKLFESPIFKEKFLNRYADLMNTVLNSSRMKGELSKAADVIEPELDRFYDRWPGYPSRSEWSGNLGEIYDWMDDRPANMFKHANSTFALGGEASLVLEVSPAGAGKIVINTVSPSSYPWTGTYFKGIPVNVTVVANKGYKFKSWTVNGGTALGNSTDINREINLATINTVKANFEVSTEFPNVVVSEFNYNSVSGKSSGDWIELYNAGTATQDLSGWLIKDQYDNNSLKIESGVSLGAGEYLVISESPSSFKKIHGNSNALYADSMLFSLSASGDEIRVYNSINEKVIGFVYNDKAPWPVLADGFGASLILKDYDSDPSLGANWSISCYLGTPGYGNDGCDCAFVVDLGTDKVSCGNNDVVLSSGIASGSLRTFSWFYNKDLIANTTSVTVNQNGDYLLVVSEGQCLAYDQIGIIDTLIVSLGSDVQLCKPSFANLTVDISASNASVVWKKNNSVLVGENNNTLRVTEAGEYKVEVKASGCNDATDIVKVTSVLPTPVDGVSCQPGNVKMSVVGTGNWGWYSALTGGSPLATGNSTTQNVSKTTTYFVGDVDFREYTVGPVDRTVNEYWSANEYSEYKLKFEVFEELTINAISVHAKAAQSVTINIRDRDEKLMKTVTQEIGEGFHKIWIGATLPAGKYIIDAEGTTGRLYMNSDGTVYPFTESGVLSIYATLPDWAENSGWYFFFYNWEVSIGGLACDRLPVTAYVGGKDCPDCNGINGGTAAIDECGVCAGGTTNIVPNSTCRDCNGIVNGGAEIDSCGECHKLTDLDYNSSCDITSTETKEAFSSLVYPNPASNQIQISLLGLVSTEIYNASGELVLISTQSSISVENLPIGVYTLKIINATQSSIVQLVIE